MPSPNLSEIITTTIENRSRTLADNVSDNSPLLFRLNRKGNVRPFDGGHVILEELEYAENSTFKYYQGYEPLNISPSDVMTAAEYPIKQAAVAVSVSGLEQLQNSGKERMINLVVKRVANAERTMKNQINVGIYSDGLGDGGKEITGLQAAVADTPTNLYGNIDRLNWPFWRNFTFDAVNDGGAPISVANIQKYMNTVYINLTRNGDQPDLIPAGNNLYQAYLESLQAIQRVASDDMAKAGFNSLKYMHADVVLGGGQGGAQDANRMYFLNTDYIFFRPHSDRNMVPLSPDRYATNQDAVIKLIGWAGNLTTSNASLQGVLTD
jgi:hypothetical protein